MSESIRVSGTVGATPEKVYQAWLGSKGHAAMTGSPAKIDPRIGGRFTAWDGYISGTTLELEPGRRIVQSWRTTEFADGSPDSRLEVRFEAAANGTRVTFIHTAIPDGQGEMYKQGWRDFYLKPMKEYFKGKAEDSGLGE